MISLNELAEEAYKTALKREKNGANIKTDTRSMLKHCATEVVEAMEEYALWMGGADVWSSELGFATELADIITCVLIIAEKENIDIERALDYCAEKNARRADGTGDKL